MQLTITVDEQEHFERLRKAYPGRKLLVVSNTSGATTWDKNLTQAVEVEKSTGVHVLPHAVKKPGCGPEIMAYFRQHPETGVTDASQVAVVGDRLTTDMMLANMMGGWGFWIKDGVVPLGEKSMVSILFGAEKDTWANSKFLVFANGEEFACIFGGTRYKAASTTACRRQVVTLVQQTRR